MTQFLLLIGQYQELDEQLNVQLKNVREEQPFLIQDAHNLFPTGDENCWTIVAPETDMSDTLFGEAHHLMWVLDIPFEETRLARALSSVIEWAETIVLWYSDDWDDLPVTEDPAEFLTQTKNQIQADWYEVYLHFEKPHR